MKIKQVLKLPYFFPADDNLTFFSWNWPNKKTIHADSNTLYPECMR